MNVFDAGRLPSGLVRVLMFMAVVRVREVRVAVLNRLMAVPMRVLALEGRLMRVQVVAVIGRMRVQVRVLQHLMAMRVGMVLGQVQPDTERHQQDSGACSQMHGL